MNDLFVIILDPELGRQYIILHQAAFLFNNSRIDIAVLDAERIHFLFFLASALS